MLLRLTYIVLVWITQITKMMCFKIQVCQKPPAGRSTKHQPTGGSSGSSSNSVSGGGCSNEAGSNSSSTRASPAGTIRAPTGHHKKLVLASNFSLDDITAQLEKVKSHRPPVALLC